MMSLKVLFMGTPDFAATCLKSLYKSGHEIVGVYSRAPAPSGRGMKLTLSPVHRLADEWGLKVFTPKNFKHHDDIEILHALQPDVIIVVAYGLLLPKVILDCPRYGCLNVHASLLPRWRGAAPIQRAIMHGDHESGVGIMRMEEGLDTGPVALEARCPITPAMTAGQLHDQLAELGSELIVRALQKLENGTLDFEPQNPDGITYAKKISNEDSQIDWTQPAEIVHDLIRGLSPFPGAFALFDFGKGPERVKILEAHPASGSGPAGLMLDDRLTVACGSKAIQLLRLQKAGSKAMIGDEFLRGHPIPAGARFS
jgi:methionyl-tRNA formyltransferase